MKRDKVITGGEELVCRVIDKYHREDVELSSLFFDQSDGDMQDERSAGHHRDAFSGHRERVQRAYALAGVR